MKNLYYRIYQNIFRLVAYLLPFKKPLMIKGKNSIANELITLLKNLKYKKIMIVTGNHIFTMGLLNPMLKALEENNIKYAIYHNTRPNPTIENVLEAKKIYIENNCECIIALGGGSPMDCAKVLGASLVSNKPINKMKGLLKVHHKLPYFIAIPTTSGSGSETTLAAVITDEKIKRKYAITDLCLIPDVAVLDPCLTINLPSNITAQTGMDALCHALEAYTNKSNTKYTKEYALKAIKLIHDNLYEAYLHNDDISARENMQEAAYLAGLAFTRAYVGNVHAIAHTIGGAYNYPHGLANAIIMPYVFRKYGDTIYQSFSEISDYLGLVDVNESKKIKTDKVISYIEELNKMMEIPKKINVLKEEDIDSLVQYAYKEANPLYPVPKIFNYNDFKEIYLQLLP